MMKTAALLLPTVMAKAGVIDGVFDLIKRQASAIRDLNALDAFDEFEDVEINDEVVQLPAQADPPNRDDFNNDDFNNLCSNFQEAVDSELELTEGLQVVEGSFSNTIHGDITQEEIVLKIVDPPQLSVFDVNEPFTLVTQGTNYAPSVFLEPNIDYYRDPQVLLDGVPVGHIHYTCEKVDGAVNDTAEGNPDGNEFDFFKGVDVGQANDLQADVEEGLPEAGLYRCCILPAGFAHQCLILPNFERKSEFDCVMYIVREGGIGGQPDDLTEAGLFNLSQPGQQN